MVDLLEIPGDMRFWIAVSLGFLILYRFIPEKKRHIAWKMIFLVLPAAGLAGGIAEWIKPFFHVLRPCAGLAFCPTDFSFPSTHSSVAFAAFGVLALLYSVWFLVPAAIIAISRVVVNVHTIVDITGGAVFGLLIAYAITSVYHEGRKNDKTGKARNPRARHR